MNQNPSRPTDEEIDRQYKNIFNAASDGLVIYDIELDTVVEANPAACAMHGYAHPEFIGLSSADFMPPESLALFKEQTYASRPHGGNVSIVEHLRQDGSVFHVEVRRTAINYLGRRCMLSIMRDVSDRVQIEKAMNKQIEDRMREQASLLAVSYTLASTSEFQPGLILDQLREIIDYTHCGLFVLQDSTLTALALRGTPQFEASPPLQIRLQDPKSLSELFRGHRPLRLADVWGETAQAQHLRSLLHEGAAAMLEGIHSWMWVPLEAKRRLLGSIGVAHKNPNYFTPHHADLAMSVANQAATTLIASELAGRAQELAVLEERQRLAQNLHDAVNQSLFSAGLIADVLPRLWDRDQDEARKSLIDLRRLTRAAQAELRALLAELRPSALTDTDLGDLLHLLGNALSGRINIPVKVKVTVAQDVVLPAEVQVAFYRVCQEALNNVAKHAKASRVDIRLEHEGTAIELRVRDDGEGFDPEQKLSGHYGLSMMRERTETVGAQLTVISQPGYGSELIMHWAKETQKEAS